MLVEALDLRGTHKGKIKRVKKYDEPFSLVIGKLDFLEAPIRQKSLSGKIRHFLAYLQTLFTFHDRHFELLLLGNRSMILYLAERGVNPTTSSPRSLRDRPANAGR